MRELDLEYYSRRMRQEREHAAQCLDMSARRVHEAMAARYSAMLREAGPELRLA